MEERERSRSARNPRMVSRLRLALVVLCVLTILVEVLVSRKISWFFHNTTDTPIHCHADKCYQNLTAPTPTLSPLITLHNYFEGTERSNSTGVKILSQQKENVTRSASVVTQTVVSSPVPRQDESAELLPRCKVPPGGFTAWRQGVVTVLTPEVPVNCSKAAAGDKEEIQRVRKQMSSWENAISDNDMLKSVQNCTWLRSYFRDNLYNSELEKSFPVAFTFVVYDSPQQVLRLLRLLYRPQNSFCIHYDARSKHRTFFKSLSDCFGNVINPSEIENVVWGHYSVLAAQLNCLTDLLQLRTMQKYKWQYVINICGKELPLLTSREIVARLIKLRGVSSIIAYKSPNTTEVMSRIKYPVKVNKAGSAIYVDHSKQLGTPPFDVKTEYYKSQSYVALSYPFAEFLTTDSEVRKIREFFKMCKNPEEHFYATVFRKPGIPGGFNRNIKHSYFYVAGAFWTYSSHNHVCLGKDVHKVCVVSLGDLQGILRLDNHLFHNKYFLEYDHTVMRCMEERIVERNKLEYQQECP